VIEVVIEVEHDLLCYTSGVGVGVRLAVDAALRAALIVAGLGT
jgi:hypothetical protein